MTSAVATILIVDDESQNRRLLEALLRPDGYLTQTAANGEEALASIAVRAPDLILLDIMMPGMDGTPLQVEVQRHAQGSSADWTIVTVVRDITERSEARSRLHQLAHYDHLTGLPNRKLFYETLGKTLAHAASSGRLVTVMFLDLDNFKWVNDTLGHARGDELLRQFSDRLVQCVRIRDTVGRLGGDEFALILMMQGSQDGAAAAAVAGDVQLVSRTPFDLQGNEAAATTTTGVTVHQGAAIVANKILRVLQAPFDLGGEKVSISVSIGIAVYPDDAADLEAPLKCADAAMYPCAESTPCWSAAR